MSARYKFKLPKITTARKMKNETPENILSGMKLRTDIVYEKFGNNEIDKYHEHAQEVWNWYNGEQPDQKIRTDFIIQYGWSIPSLESLNSIVQVYNSLIGPHGNHGVLDILEVFGGLGLWSCLLSKIGFNVKCTSLY